MSFEAFLDPTDTFVEFWGHVAPRIIYIRFLTIAAVYLRRIKNQNTEAEIQKLIVESSGHLLGKSLSLKRWQHHIEAPSFGE